MRIIFFIIIFAFFSISLFAQVDASKADWKQVPHIDVIYLKNGSQLRGRILSYTPGESMDFELIGDATVKMRIKEKDIKKIVQERVDSPQKIEKPRAEYNFKEKGIYNISYVSSLSGISPRKAWSLGGSLQHIIGYQFSRFVGAGVGAGIDLYNTDIMEAIIPIFAEGRGYLFAQNFTPYYSLSAGYGISIKDEASQVKRAKGGFMIHPSIGYRIGGSSKVNFLIDVGIKLQHATYIRGNVSDWTGEVTEERLFKRFTLRLGLVF